MFIQKKFALAISVIPFQNGVMFQMLIVAASSVVAKFCFTDPTCRTIFRRCQKFLLSERSMQPSTRPGASAQLPERACEWTLVSARVEHLEWHYIPEWHSDCNNTRIGNPVRQPLTKAVVQTSINNLNVFKSFPLMLAPTFTLLSNAMKFARIHARTFRAVVLKVVGIAPMWASLRGKRAKKQRWW